MNTRKAYRMLIVVLFFAFISLISRSIVYLILSVLIATIIIFLLGNAKKKDKVNNVIHTSLAPKDKGNLLVKILLVVMAVGFLLIAYGALYFIEAPYFLQIIPLPEQYLTVIAILAVGCFVIVGSLYYFIKELLNEEK
ncbi:hypothetical protein BKP37_07095 [Anaerobacillus alkalilacustris]|uniref:Uncharacterized protein n=1 Tax=Anaerobacillus alkalilacustris TaxID=393763 RepID=A0A1S2LQE7_9BACI|nr:hypothetical protein [Anaerobacillus alkalilacustris]OIJ14739.1 hypothetical protein BKP37_07095 [Anaerobacillus alkalilacustris]